MTGQVVQWHHERVLWTVERAAKELDVDPSSVRRLMDAGDLKYVDISPSGTNRRTIRIEDVEIARFIANRRRPPETEE